MPGSSAQPLACDTKSHYWLFGGPVGPDQTQHSPTTRLGNILRQFKVKGTQPHDDVIEQDIVLFWRTRKRILTGANILGRLMRGISKKEA